jgi:enoyl-[acyl-carrier-protein] reductase (NADH)
MYTLFWRKIDDLEILMTAVTICDQKNRFIGQWVNIPHRLFNKSRKISLYIYIYTHKATATASGGPINMETWYSHAASWKVTGLIPDEVIGFFN